MKQSFKPGVTKLELRGEGIISVGRVGEVQLGFSRRRVRGIHALTPHYDPTVVGLSSCDLSCDGGLVVFGNLDQSHIQILVRNIACLVAP